MSVMTKARFEVDMGITILSSTISNVKHVFNQVEPLYLMFQAGAANAETGAL